MTKILSPAMLAGLALTAGSTVLNAYGQRQAQQAQDQANQRWLDYQKKQTDRFSQMERDRRDEAYAALNENLEGSTEEARREVIDAETERLTEDQTADLPEIAQDTVASGQGPGISQVFDEALAGSLKDATTSAKDRIAAMARATAYGGGSRGGMGLNDLLSGRQAAQDIGFVNDIRRGNTDILRRYQEVQPEVVTYQRSPLVDILGAAGQVAFGGGFDGVLGGGAAASGFTPTQSAWTNPMTPGAAATKALTTTGRPAYTTDQMLYGGTLP
jgi:hypothetical protein